MIGLVQNMFTYNSATINLYCLSTASQCKRSGSADLNHVIDGSNKLKGSVLNNF